MLVFNPLLILRFIYFTTALHLKLRHEFYPAFSITFKSVEIFILYYIYMFEKVYKAAY